MLNPVSKSTPRENRTIVVPFDQDKYPEMILKPDFFLDSQGDFPYSSLPIKQSLKGVKSKAPVKAGKE